MRRQILIQLGCALVLLFATLGAYVFWHGMVGKASAEAAALGVTLQNTSADVARLNAAKEALGSLAADEAAVRQYLIHPADIVPFLERIEETGSALGSRVEVLSVSEDAGEQRGNIRLSLKVSGSFNAVMRTLGALEYGAYDSSIENLNLDTTRGESGTVWNGALTLRVGTQGASVPRIP